LNGLIKTPVEDAHTSPLLIRTPRPQEPLPPEHSGDPYERLKERRQEGLKEKSALESKYWGGEGPKKHLDPDPDPSPRPRGPQDPLPPEHLGDPYERLKERRQEGLKEKSAPESEILEGESPKKHRDLR
jgi:hypothetical protein